MRSLLQPLARPDGGMLVIGSEGRTGMVLDGEEGGAFGTGRVTIGGGGEGWLRGGGGCGRVGGSGGEGVLVGSGWLISLPALLR